MTREEFLDQVQELAQLPDRAAAERATKVVFELLSRRLTGGESYDLAQQLAPDLRELWDPATLLDAQMGVSRKAQLDYQTIDDLYELVEERLEEADIDAPADVVTGAVLSTLKSQLTADEADDVTAQLPQELKKFWDSL